ncbi:hypothetical protein GCM10007100_37480 [Roseibacillus persicicus]|uniref:Uncharacterized protein n=1 Tax=Roseibacillus persicicus TaxID=454148 RepID=A0A918TYN3_9BACT|nr:hypothetical protein GCM10007100_37480 [Roseibacillus persicicus]
MVEEARNRRHWGTQANFKSLSDMPLSDRKRLSDWTDEIEDFGILWTKFSNSGLSGADTEALKRVLILRLAETRGLQSACDFVRNQMGPGAARCFYLVAAFEAADANLQEMFTLVEKLEFQDERDAAIEALRIRAHDWEEFALGDFDISRKLNPVEVEIYKMVIGREFLAELGEGRASRGDVGDFQELLRGFNGLLEEGIVSKDDYSSVIFSVANQYPFEVFASLSDGKVLESEVTNVGNLVFPMIAQDAPRAVELLTRSSAISSEILTDAYSEFIRIDSKGAFEWFEKSEAELSETMKNAIELSFVESALKSSEIDGAKEWASRLTDPESIARAEGRINVKQGELLKSQTWDNPSETLSGITGGAASTEPFWVEVAMEQWLKKDAAQAYEWYQENQKTLTPEQDERVALAYAREGVRQGDLDAAGEWAQRIVDPELRKVVEGEIAGAGE